MSDGAAEVLDHTSKARAMQALGARGFREIGVDGNGLPLFTSVSGALLIGIGSCRSLAYSPIGRGGRLQLIATTRTAALLCRISFHEVAPANFFPIQAGDFPPASSLTVPVVNRAPVESARVYEFVAPSRVQFVLDDDPEETLPPVRRSIGERAPEREHAYA